MSTQRDKPKPDSTESPAVPDSQRVVLEDAGLPANLEVIRLLGHGSMATVMLARDTVLKRLVAVKVLRKEFSADPTSRRRFEREAQAAARLSLDHVTTVYSVGRSDADVPYIEMEYVDGRNLAEVLTSRGPFAIDEAMDLLVQISSALAAAHEQGIVHRDIKPANILIDNKTGQAILTDFGVAAILETGTETVTRLTRADERIGDPRYMSPEQLRGETLTGQSDVYGLGIIAYELLTGKGPFDVPEIGSMANAHLRRPPPDLSQMRTDVPQSLSDVLKRCLSKNPQHRPCARDLPRLLHEPVDPLESDNHEGAIAGFLRELKNRKVYRAAAAYAAATFLILQAADLVFPALTDSDTPYRIVVIGCLAGFPVTIILAWIFDLRNWRLVRTDDADSALERSATPIQRLLLNLAGLGLSIGLVVLIARWLLSD